ncbi:recombinase family protein [Nonomuraea terrae]|uniref:recombinase family protein n=1 Tax=Nonomuraea terrae TaxID=2530383 RepID=UPI00378F6C9F
MSGLLPIFVLRTSRKPVSQNRACDRFCDITELVAPAAAVEQFDGPMCEAPAGSTCRTRGGRVAPKYLMLVPQLRTELEVRIPAERGPGRVWQAGRRWTPWRRRSRPGRPGSGMPGAAGAGQSARCPEEAGCEPIFAEKISTRIKVRPEFAKAMEYARTIKTAVPHQRVMFTVHEMKRLGRGAAELLAIAEELRRHARCRASTTPPGMAQRCSPSSPAWRSRNGSMCVRSRWRVSLPRASAAATAGGRGCSMTT